MLPRAVAQTDNNRHGCTSRALANAGMIGNHCSPACEYLPGTSGKAGNLEGQIQPGGDPHESPRSREYPTPAQKEHFSGALFRKAANSLGYHPFPQPSSNLSQPYTNPEGLKLNTCVFCGFCERYDCEHYAKSTPQTFILPVLLANSNFELRSGCQVQRINLDSTKKRATGVTYIDAAGHRWRGHRAKRPILRRNTRRLTTPAARSWVRIRAPVWSIAICSPGMFPTCLSSGRRPTRRTLPPGASVGYHVHPGDEAGYIIKGSVTWKVRGQADKTLKAGDSFFNPRGSVHSIVSADSGDSTVISTWIVDKGKPMSTPVP
jgi:mannose-6-phosphate isomerase-like protein (cupin superfamily)